MAHHISDLLGGDNQAILSFNKEETSNDFSNGDRLVENWTELTMGFGLLGAAWATVDQASSALTNGALGVVDALNVVRLSAGKGAQSTYGVLAESEWHLFSITTDLDEDDAVLAENLGDGSLKSLLGLGLKKT